MLLLATLQADQDRPLHLGTILLVYQVHHRILTADTLDNLFPRTLQVIILVKDPRGESSAVHYCFHIASTIYSDPSL